MTRLSWDLHIHPGPSPVPRWGDGFDVWRACRDAGLSGFVWKSHEHDTVADCARLPAAPPLAIPGASLNSWANLDSVLDALERGARWIWGPSQDHDGQTAWDLPLPDWWPELRSALLQRSAPVALATAHLDRGGRRTFAETAAAAPHLHCTVTHSTRLHLDEVLELAQLGGTFELDLYTAVFEVGGSSWSLLTARARELGDAGCAAYITSDAGQEHVGNPLEFSTGKLGQLELELGINTVYDLAVSGPETFVGRVLGGDLALTRNGGEDGPEPDPATR